MHSVDTYHLFTKRHHFKQLIIWRCRSQIGDLEARSSEQKLTSICDTVPDLTREIHVFAVISRESSNKGSLGRGNTCVAAVNTEDVQHMDISTLIERLVPVTD